MVVNEIRRKASTRHVDVFRLDSHDFVRARRQPGLQKPYCVSIHHRRVPCKIIHILKANFLISMTSTSTLTLGIHVASHKLHVHKMGHATGKIASNRVRLGRNQHWQHHSPAARRASLRGRLLSRMGLNFYYIRY